MAKLAVLGLVSGALAGCSSDATRLTSLTSPYPPATQGSPEVTGSLGAAPTARVDSGALGSPALAAAPTAPSGPPVAYAPASYPGPASMPTQVAPAMAAAPVTSMATSTHVVVGGETLTSIARSYGTTAAQVASLNGMPPDAVLRIGQPLTVPRTSTTVAQPHVVAAPVAVAPKPAVVAGTQAAVPVPPAAKPVTAPPAAPAAAKTSPVQAAGMLAAPTAAPVATAPAPASAKGAAAPAAQAAKTAAVAQDDADDAPRAAGSGPQFRAPVRGRVISGFGPKPGGARNDGVNFAVPEGTSVRSAEDGTVAYAGNELKGYGNLVLIKHADGYVTAYAHNSELLVKRGDTVRRGQIVAKAGQSGGVSTPQLHFEIRKGSQPVDPSQYVAGL
ncbi:M23 family metallopeptidase [Aquabacter spiritensis]|uniref:M23 family metallopeptidase n=1 Tax=Aquabacter spiritensis TaxID=933073 RepID=UPI001FDF525B|nr:M23 family metallopeptidase [Aquabacter spiritensis]